PKPAATAIHLSRSLNAAASAVPSANAGMATSMAVTAVENPTTIFPNRFISFLRKKDLVGMCLLVRVLACVLVAVAFVRHRALDVHHRQEAKHHRLDDADEHAEDQERHRHE